MVALNSSVWRLAGSLVRMALRSGSKEASSKRSASSMTRNLVCWKHAAKSGSVTSMSCNSANQPMSTAEQQLYRYVHGISISQQRLWCLQVYHMQQQFKNLSLNLKDVLTCMLIYPNNRFTVLRAERPDSNVFNGLGSEDGSATKVVCTLRRPGVATTTCGRRASAFAWFCISRPPTMTTSCSNTSKRWSML